MKDWSDEDQPRKKLLQKGAENLSNAELLAIIINTGTAQQSALELGRNLMNIVDNDMHKLAGLSVVEIVKKKVKGLGEAKAVGIVAALELGIRRTVSEKKKTLITRSSDIAQFLQARFAFNKQEVFVIVLLNRANKITHTEIISEGGITGTVADPRVILKKALEHNATSLILCHNHPSGNTKPSKADELLTQKIKQAAALIDVALIDHIIVSNEGWFSFADEGML